MVMYILVLSVCLFYLIGMTLAEAAGYEWVITVSVTVYHAEYITTFCAESKTQKGSYQ